MLNFINEGICKCGKAHLYDGIVHTGSGAVCKLAEVLSQLKAKCVYLISDRNTHAVAGDTVTEILNNEKIPYSSFMYEHSPKPNEESVGAALMHCPAEADTVIAIGSGVINDIGKLLSARCKMKYIIVATAPSMDGYASSTSSMCRGGHKISLSSMMPDVIIGDTDILATAPKKMFLSGLGDMLAKYVAICEWRISRLITGEYYCEKIARMVRDALAHCIKSVERSGFGADASEAVFVGLVQSGVAMHYAGISRPASGCEHYVSHIYDMRGELLGTATEMHGLQCAVATLLCSKIYHTLIKITPCRQKALAHVRDFDSDGWYNELASLVGESVAQSMHSLDETEKKYDVDRHALRLDVIIDNWQKICEIVKEELPSYEQLLSLYERLGIPRSFEELSMQVDILPKIILATKDIRDKYILTRLLFDIGEMGLVNELITIN